MTSPHLTEELTQESCYLSSAVSLITSRPIYLAYSAISGTMQFLERDKRSVVESE